MSYRIRFNRGWSPVPAIAAVFALLTPVAAAAAPDSGAPATVKSSPAAVIYRAPAGWKRLSAARMTFLVPADLPAGQNCSITILPAQPLEASAIAVFNSVRQTLRAGETLVRDVPTRVIRTRSNGIVVASEETKANSGQHFYRFYFGMKAGARLAMFSYSASSPEVFARYRPALEGFIEGLSLVQHVAHPRAKLPNAPADLSRFVGEWTGIAPSTTIGSLKLKSDGTYTRSAGDGGTYTVSGDKVNFTGPLTAWNSGHADLDNKGNLEFYWRDQATGLMQYFCFARYDKSRYDK